MAENIDKQQGEEAKIGVLLGECRSSNAGQSVDYSPQKAPGVALSKASLLGISVCFDSLREKMMSPEKRERLLATQQDASLVGSLFRVRCETECYSITRLESTPEGVQIYGVPAGAHETIEAATEFIQDLVSVGGYSEEEIYRRVQGRYHISEERAAEISSWVLQSS